ncbi:MAG TPA: hypothetical protein VLF41_02270 [Candidatus Nanoarchaeia archaeon]|nr:hypothetical protein [Candidatus Nanoarchaeia archaeon]
MAKRKNVQTETIITPEGEPRTVETLQSTYVAPDPALKAQIDQAKSELEKEKPVVAEKTVGTNNVLIFNLKIREVFRVICWLLALGAIGWSAYLVYSTRVNYKERLRLVPQALKAFGLLTPIYWAWVSADVKHIGFVFGGAIVLLLCWLFSQRSTVAVLITRLAMLAFWIIAAYWIYSVLGLGQTIPTYIF